MKLLLKNLLAVCVTSTMLLPMSSYAGNTIKFAIENQEYQFVTLTFHDVRDDVAAVGDRDMYAISTKNLAQYFAWLKQEGWNPIRLEDVWQARVAKKPLPPKAVLLTFDDGALSSYNRVFLYSNNMVIQQFLPFQPVGLMATPKIHTKLMAWVIL